MSKVRTAQTERIYIFDILIIGYEMIERNMEQEESPMFGVDLQQNLIWLIFIKSLFFLYTIKLTTNYLPFLGMERLPKLRNMNNEKWKKQKKNVEKLGGKLQG